MTTPSSGNVPCIHLSQHIQKFHFQERSLRSDPSPNNQSAGQNTIHCPLQTSSIQGQSPSQCGAGGATNLYQLLTGILDPYSVQSCPDAVEADHLATEQTTDQITRGHFITLITRHSDCGRKVWEADGATD